MSDFLDLLGDGSLIVDEESGEIVEQQGAGLLATLAQRRHDAYAQKKRWEEILANYDRVLLANHGSGAYGPLVIRERTGSYSKTDVERFLAELPILATAEFAALLAAATGFARDKLPVVAVPTFDAATQKLSKRPWIESMVAAKAAPAIARVQREGE